MIQDTGITNFDNAYRAHRVHADDRVLVFHEGSVLMRKHDGRIALPRAAELDDAEGRCLYLFSVDGERFFLLRGDGHLTAEGCSYEDMQDFRAFRPWPLPFICTTAQQLARWYDDNRFCGRCATPTEPDAVERMLRCPACGNMIYPKISPGIIVAISDGDDLLLTRYAGRPYGLYALVAGFSEIGEAIEDTVHREVMEEVGLKVKNLRFYKSQPWALSSTLLAGFFAELDGSRDITLDTDELAEALWMPARDVLSLGDDGISLTREMMRVFAESRIEGRPLPGSSAPRRR